METTTCHSEERDRDQFDEVIDNLHLIEATGKEREELHEVVRKALVSLNLAYAMADVADYLLKDVEQLLWSVKVPYNDRDKAYFKEWKKLTCAARKWAKKITHDLYRRDDAEETADDFDWWFNMIRLIADRTGEDKLKTKQVIQWLAHMPSVMHLFDGHTKGFIHEQRAQTQI